MYSRNDTNYARFSPAPNRRLFLGVNPFVIQMPNGDEHTYSTIDPQIAADINGGGRPIRPGGGFYNVSMFEGGYLFDNCPLNVILGNGWISGQQSALYAAGITPGCPQVGPVGVQAMNPPAPLTTSPVVPAPAASTQIVNGPAFVQTSTAPGIVTSASPAAPQTSVVSSTGSAPAVPIQVTDSGMSATPEAATPAPDNTLMYVALAGIALLFLMKGK